MARYGATIVSQTQQLAGVNATTTVNGYMGYWGASATAGFRLRRLQLGVMTTSATVPTSQQIQVGIYRQTVAPSGSGIAAAVPGQAFEPWTLQTDPTAGLFAITATTIGTTGPTLASNAIVKPTFNSQTTLDVPYELIEEIVCSLGTANGVAFVNLGNTLPANHYIQISAEIEV
jgi:hypothetical protein